MNIHEILEHGEIVGNDEALDVLVIYNDDTKEAILFQGDTNGEYSLTDTLADVDDDETSINDAIDSLLSTPE